MKFIKFFVSFSFVFLLSFVACPFAFASEAYNIPFSQPQVVDGSGYIEVLFERANGSRYVRLFQWQTPTATDWTELDLPIPLFLTINRNGFIEFKFDSAPEAVFYSVITIVDPSLSNSYFDVWQNLSNEGKVTRSLDYDDNIVSFNIYGSYAKLTSNMVGAYIPKFTVTYGDDTSLSDVSSALTQINNNLLQLHNDNLIFKEDVEYIQSQLTDYFELLHSDNISINNSIIDIIAWLEFIKNQLNDFSDRVHTDLEASRLLLVDIKSILSEMNIVLANIDTTTTNINTRLYSLYNLLNRNVVPDLRDVRNNVRDILDLLNQTVTNNLTSPDTSNMDGYIDTENSLLDNSNVDVSDVVQVEVNQNALTFIWSLVQQIFDSNGKVFGMVLTVLSLGLVAMVLGRKV